MSRDLICEGDDVSENEEKKKNWISFIKAEEYFGEVIRLELSGDVRGEKGESFELSVDNYYTANALLSLRGPASLEPGPDDLLCLVINPDGVIRASFMKQALGGKGDRVFVLQSPLLAQVVGDPVIRVRPRSLIRG